MPYKWVPPELFLKHNGMSIYHVYHDDDINQGKMPDLYANHINCTYNGEDGFSHFFEIETLINYDPNRTHEDIIREAIDAGLITKKAEPVPIRLYHHNNRDRDVTELIVNDESGIGMHRVYVPTEEIGKRYVRRLLELNKKKLNGETNKWTVAPLEYLKAGLPLKQQASDSFWGYIGPNGELIRITKEEKAKTDPRFHGRPSLDDRGMYFTFEYKSNHQDVEWTHIATIFYRAYFSGWQTPRYDPNYLHDFKKRETWLLDNWFEGDDEMTALAWSGEQTF